MTPGSLQRSLWVAAAVVVPAAVGYLLTDDARTAAELALPPFVWPRLFVAHLALAVPLGLVLGARLSAHDVAPATWAVVGIVVAGLVGWLTPALADAAVSTGADFPAMLLLRSALALVLVLPWCVPAAGPVGGGWVIAAAVGLAVVPCALYADGLAAARAEQARELVERERLVRAGRVLAALRELGTDRTVGKDAPGVLAKKLTETVGRYEKAVSRPLPADAPDDVRLNRALTLIPLDRLDEAAALLEPLAGGDLPAALLATVYQEQERWPESDALFARLLAGSSATAATALDGLVFNARESRRPADVEKWLRRGLEMFPDRASEFHFKLGQHFAHAGRPNRAVEAFSAAAAADPKRYGEKARTQIDQLRTATPACVLTPRHG